jgi:molecular chaperone HtpG
MRPDQKHIYFMTGDDLSQMAQSPYLERLKDKGFEVLFFNDPIDEWVTQSLIEYKGKKLQSVMREDLDLDSEAENKAKEEKQRELNEKYKDLIEEFKSTLKDQVKDVRVSHRLKSTPVCLVSGEHDPSARMQKIYSQMGPGNPSIPAGQRILEVNFEHPVFEKLKTSTANLRKDLIEILYSQALLHEGSPLPNPTRYTQLISNLMLASH